MNDKKIICIAVDDEPPALDLLTKYISSVKSLELAATCSDAVEALNFLRKNPVDLVFLDIKMPELLGTEFIRALRNPPKVIFTTAYRKYAVEGFELDAVDYLLKPISFDRFLKAINKVMDENLKEFPELENGSNEKKANGEEYLHVRADRKMLKIAHSDIYYIESLKDYVKIVTTGKTIITKQPISSLEEILPKTNFVRIHRSFIVNLNKIDSYTNELMWIGKNELPISRMYRNEIEKLLKR
jgi:DNA-binding LytR/AlgR family response regulator